MNRRRGSGGRRCVIRLSRRRIILTLSLTLTLILLLILANPLHRIPTTSSEFRQSAAHGRKHAKDFIQNPNIPALYNPFSDSTHEPPDQAGSKSGDTKWYNDWRWLRSFSSQVTLDDGRALLPPLPDRPVIYTYYNPSERTGKGRDAEHQLLLTWRRAWWAKGFKPVVLGHAEAQKNEARWRHMERVALEPSLKQELERWLAWDYIGGGILVDWLLVPMSGHDDPTLARLRRGNFDGLVRCKSFGTGFLGANHEDVGRALSVALGREEKAETKDIFALLSGITVTTDEKHEALAYYDSTTLTSLYPDVAKEITFSRAAGLESLNTLINAHLSQTWQSQFPAGIAIVKTHTARTTALSNFAVHIAQTLSLCRTSPLPKSCPPNRPSCKACDPDHALPLSLPSAYSNTTGLFTLGTVPHPLTLTALLHTTDKLTTPFIRRFARRDQYLNTVTSSLLDTGISGPQRLMGFKEAVVGGGITEHSGAGASANSGSWAGMWFTAEREDPVELEWVLGFALPESRAMEDPVALQARLERERPRAPGQLVEGEVKAASPEQLKKEKALMSTTRTVLYGKSRAQKATREVVEAWNLADTEAWRFVRALGMRRQLERVGWEEEESVFAGSR